MNNYYDNRIAILTKKEIDEIYGIPQFSPEDQLAFFHLSTEEEKIMISFRNANAKIFFILLLGYFKAKRMLFPLNIEIMKADIEFIIQKYQQEHCFKIFQKVPKATLNKVHNNILKLSGYIKHDLKIKKDLKERAAYYARIYTNPFFIFKELLNYLEDKKIILPGFSFFQKLIGSTLELEKKRLGKIIKKQLRTNEKKLLSNLLDKTSYLHEIAFLKQEPKNFSNQEMSEEIRRKTLIKEVYSISQRLLPLLSISNENIAYYGALATYYSTYKLQRMDEKISFLLILCYINHKYKKINDNLVACFIHHITWFLGQAEKYGREELLYSKVNVNQNLKKVNKILDIIFDDTLPSETPIGELQNKIYKIIDRRHMKLLKSFLSNDNLDKKRHEWNYFQKHSHQFKIRLRQIFQNIEYHTYQVTPLIEAINFVKSTLDSNNTLIKTPDDRFPVEFISQNYKKYIYDTRFLKIRHKKHRFIELNKNKYEFFVYKCLKERFEAGDIFIKDSINFRSLEDDLVDEEVMQQSDKIIKMLQIKGLEKSIEDVLIELEERLEAKYSSVNKNILDGNNSYVKINPTNKKYAWETSKDQYDFYQNNNFYQQLTQTNIINIIKFVDTHSSFLKVFTHILEKNIKTKTDNINIIASIIAMGTNIGIKKMSEISDIDYKELIRTSKNYFRLETLNQANDIIINNIQEMKIFQNFSIDEAGLHSGSDGQKFSAQFDTVNSRYSPKYFGLEKGITSYSLVANHIPIYAKNIGAHEHESYYVFDLLYNNTSDIEPLIHSTDSHGINHVNFAILDFFGLTFAPRYKDIKTKFKQLIGFKNISQYKKFIVKPYRKIDKELIISEWAEIKKIIISLALRTTNQSTIIRKLCSHSRKNRTQKALWEYDSIFSTLHILDFLDSEIFRKNIGKALNRVESYHQLKRAIFHENKGKFRVHTEVEQQIWSECTRLIANCIIYYNCIILETLLTEKEKYGSLEEVEIIKKITPLAWTHINLIGFFNFKEDSDIIINDLIRDIDVKF